MRDNQRQRVYRAEWSTWPADDLSPEGDFETVRDIQKFVNQVLTRPIWKKSTLRRQVLVRLRIGHTATAFGYFIEVGREAMYKHVVLHELAHCWFSNHHRIADHGPEFVMVYRRLIEDQFGRDVLVRFDRNCEVSGAKWTDADDRTRRLLAKAN